jgi:hypothetical protein
MVGVNGDGHLLWLFCLLPIIILLVGGKECCILHGSGFTLTGEKWRK